MQMPALAITAYLTRNLVCHFDITYPFSEVYHISPIPMLSAAEDSTEMLHKEPMIWNYRPLAYARTVVCLHCNSGELHKEVTNTGSRSDTCSVADLSEGAG